MTEDELRRMLRTQDGPHDPTGGGWAGTAVRAGRRRRLVRRAAGTGAILALVAAVVVGAQALPPTLTAPVQPASPSVTATPTPTGTDPAPTSTASVEEPAVETSVLASFGHGGVTLWQAAPGGSLTELRRLDPPTPEQTYPSDVALAAGPDPLACVVWDDWTVVDDEGMPDYSISCYAAGSSDPSEVSTPDDVWISHVALRPDGSALAWSEYAPEGNGRVVVAPLDGTAAGEPDTWLADPTRPAGRDTFTGLGVSDLAFAGDTSRVVVSVQAQSDDGGGLGIIDAADPTGTWRPQAPFVSPQEPQVHDTLDGVRSATGDTAWAVLATDGLLRLDTAAPGDVAVEVSLSDGRVLRTLVTPAEGRDVLSVSGNSRTIAYVTRPSDEGDAPGERRHYLRWTGEDAGTLLEGLGDAVADIVLGP